MQQVSFDLLVPKVLAGTPPVARLLDFLRDARLQGQLSGLPGYEVSDTGKLL